jgi:hypothetical protein
VAICQDTLGTFLDTKRAQQKSVFRTTEDDEGKKAIDVARDAATLDALNAVLHGRPSVKTLAMQEAARQAEQEELAEQLAE